MAPAISTESGPLTGGGADCPASKAIHALALQLTGEILNARVDSIMRTLERLPLDSPDRWRIESDLTMHMASGSTVDMLLQILQSPESGEYRPLNFEELHDIISLQFPEYRCLEFYLTHPDYATTPADAEESPAPTQEALPEDWVAWSAVVSADGFYNETWRLYNRYTGNVQEGDWSNQAEAEAAATELNRKGYENYKAQNRPSNPRAG